MAFFGYVNISSMLALRNRLVSFSSNPRLSMHLTDRHRLAYNLHRFPQNEIHKGALQIAEKQLAKKRRLIDWYVL
jgi:hypothetical protein